MNSRLLKSSGVLCAVSGSCLIAVLLLVWFDGGSAHEERKSLMFIRSGVLESLGGLALFCTVSMFTLLARSFKEVVHKGWVILAMALSTAAYPCTLVAVIFLGFAKTCSWYDEGYVKGSDNRTYYILHASPPANGPGHSALARRTGG